MLTFQKVNVRGYKYLLKIVIPMRWAPPIMKVINSLNLQTRDGVLEITIFSKDKLHFEAPPIDI